MPGTASLPRPRRHRRASTPGARTNVCASSARRATSTATVALPLGDFTAEQARAAGRHLPASSPATPCAPPSSRTSCCAGSPRPTCPSSTRAASQPISAAPGAGDDRGHRRLPRHRHLQAGDLGLARPGRRARASRFAERELVPIPRPRRCTSRPAAASTPAASTTSPTSAFSASAATSTGAACPTSSSCSAASGATTAAPTAWRSARFRPSACPRSSTAHRAAGLRRAPGRARSFQALRRAHRQAASVQRLIDDLTRGARLRGRPDLLHATGATPREYTIGDMGVGECAGEVVTLAEFGLAGQRARGVRGADRTSKAAQRGEAPTRGLRGHAQRRQGAHLACRTSTSSDDAEPDRRRVPQRAFTTPGCSTIRSPAAKFANYLFSVTKPAQANATRTKRAPAIEEAQLFIEAAHACYERMPEKRS